MREEKKGTDTMRLRYFDEDYLLHILMCVWSIAFCLCMILLPCWIVGTVYADRIIDCIRTEKVLIDIRKTEPPRKSGGTLRLPWRVCDVAMRDLGDGVELCSVKLECVIVKGGRE